MKMQGRWGGQSRAAGAAARSRRELLGALWSVAASAGLGSAAGSRAQAVEAPLVIGRVVGPSLLSDIAASVMRDACQRAGIALEFRELPLLRSIEMANDGDIDADLMRITEAGQRYTNLIAVPTAVSRVDIAIYAATPDIADWTRARISAMRIGIVRGTLAIAKHTRGMNVVETAYDEPIHDMLAGGRLDAAALVHVDTESMMSSGQMPRMFRWPYLWAAEPLYPWVHRRRASLVPRLSAALRLLDSEGVVERTYRTALQQAGIVALPVEGAAAKPAAR